MLVIPLAALRWWLLLRALGLQISPRRTFLLTWIGNFFNSTLPGAVTGDFVKGYYIVKTHAEESRTNAFMTVLIDRFVGLFGLIVISFFSLVANLSIFLENPRLHGLIWMICLSFFATTCFYSLVIYFSRISQIKNYAAKFHNNACLWTSSHRNLLTFVCPIIKVIIKRI